MKRQSWDCLDRRYRDKHGKKLRGQTLTAESSHPLEPPRIASLGRGFRSGRQREMKRASLAIFRLHPNLAAVMFDHSLAVGQADAVAWNFFAARSSIFVAMTEVEYLVPVVDLGGVFRVLLDADAIVADAE